MLADGLRDRHEDHAGLLQLFLEGGHDRDGIEYRIDGDPRRLHASEHFLLAQRNAELFIDLQNFRIDIFDRRRAGRALRRGVIVDIVEIDLRIVDARPGRLFKRQPALIGPETPFKHPFRLLLLRRNETDDVFGQALGRLVHLDRRFQTHICTGPHRSGRPDRLFPARQPCRSPISPDTRSGSLSVRCNFRRTAYVMAKGRFSPRLPSGKLNFRNFVVRQAAAPESLRRAAIFAKTSAHRSISARVVDDPIDIRNAPCPGSCPIADRT